MGNYDAYSALTNIYDAAVDPGRWRRALDAVTDASEAKAVIMVIRKPNPAVPETRLFSSVYLDFCRTAWGAYYGVSLGHLQNADWDFLRRQSTHRLVPDTDIGPSMAELDARPDYAFLRERLGVGRRIGVRLNDDRMWFDAMSIGYDVERDAVSSAALDGAEFLLPHLTKAVELGRTFAELKRRYAAVLTTLDRVMVGLAIALPNGEIIVENEEARRILAQGDGLTKQRNGKLCCADADQTAELSDHIHHASHTARGEADRPESLMAVRRRSVAAPLLVDVAPLKDGAAELDAHLDGALITIIDPERIPKLKMERFVMLYKLTAAEAEVCAMVLQGMPLPEIAERRSTSPLTAKNQVAAILQKTGVSRRAELIRLVLRVLPPVD